MKEGQAHAGPGSIWEDGIVYREREPSQPLSRAVADSHELKSSSGILDILVTLRSTKEV